MGSGGREDEVLVLLDNEDAIDDEDDVDEVDTDELLLGRADELTLDELAGVEFEETALLLLRMVPLPTLVACEDDTTEEDDVEEDESETDVDDVDAVDDAGDADDADDEMLLVITDDELVRHAGLKTHWQPPVQFSPSSSHVGALQPRPQVGSAYVLLIFTGSHSSKRDGLMMPSPQ